jgi:hypothetical protein
MKRAPLDTPDHRQAVAGQPAQKVHVINTWVAEGNPSIRILERTNFRPIGRQRQCHLDGRPYDRRWFDLLATEHREI